jgi:hypothetical protein
MVIPNKRTLKRATATAAQRAAPVPEIINQNDIVVNSLHLCLAMGFCTALVNMKWIDQ